MATLNQLSTFSSRAESPKATFALPVVLYLKAQAPIPILEFVVLFSKAFEPMAIFLCPITFEMCASVPMATLPRSPFIFIPPTLTSAEAVIVLKLASAPVMPALAVI